MQKSETFTIVLEGAEERTRLAEAIHDHFQWQDHQGYGEESNSANSLYNLFKELTGCTSLSEYRERRDLRLTHLFPDTRKKASRSSGPELREEG